MKYIKTAYLLVYAIRCSISIFVERMLEDSCRVKKLIEGIVIYRNKSISVCVCVRDKVKINREINNYASSVVTEKMKVSNTKFYLPCCKRKNCFKQFNIVNSYT